MEVFNNLKKKNKMKKLFFLIVVATTLFACTKSSLAPLDQQKGRKDKTTALTVAVATSVNVDWTPEDAIVSIDSANWTTHNAYTGNDIYWSVRGDESLLPSFCGTIVEVFIAANQPDKWGVSSPTDHWTTIGQDYYLTYAPGKAGAIFDGYPGQTETRIYRAKMIDKSGVVHISSPYQVN